MSAGLLVDERRAVRTWDSGSEWLATRAFLGRCGRLSLAPKSGHVLIECDDQISARTLVRVMVARGVPRSAITMGGAA